MTSHILQGGHSTGVVKWIGRVESGQTLTDGGLFLQGIQFRWKRRQLRGTRSQGRICFYVGEAQAYSGHCVRSSLVDGHISPRSAGKKAVLNQAKGCSESETEEQGSKAHSGNFHLKGEFPQGSSRRPGYQLRRMSTGVWARVGNGRMQ